MRLEQQLHRPYQSDSEQWLYAIAALATLGGLLFYVNNQNEMGTIIPFLKNNQNWLIVSGSFCLINLYYWFQIFKRAVLLQGQGKRLQSLTNEKKAKVSLLPLLIWSIPSYLVSLTILNLWPVVITHHSELALYKYTHNFALINVGVFLLTLLMKVAPKVFNIFRFKKKDKFPKVPNLENKILIGTTGELTA